MENVVAAMLVPANHHPSDRPDRKKSVREPEARLDRAIPIPIVPSK